MRFQGETFVFKFFPRNVNGKHLVLFQSETSVFKFLRRSVDGASVAFIEQLLLVQDLLNSR